MRLPPPWLRALRLPPAVPPPPPPPPAIVLTPHKRRLPPPWLRALPSLRAPGLSPGEVSDDDTPPGLSHAGTNKNFIPRDPQIEPRTRAHTERVAVALNDLFRTGQLYVNEDGVHVIVVGPQHVEVPGSPGGAGLTGTFPT